MLRLGRGRASMLRRAFSNLGKDDNLNFVGQVAVITGAGGALGQAYALDLAQRGCSLVLNDIGASLTGEDKGATKSNLEQLADKIASLNKGKVVLNTEPVQEGHLIIEQAVKEFGKVDILINNAGNLRDKSFSKMTTEDWHSVVNTHLNGTFSVTHAAWPHMVSAQYGRIVTIGSGAGLYGNFGQANYSSAKMGILGLTQTLAKEGTKYNIAINCVVPVAASRMTETVLSPVLLKELNPHHISPIVTYLTSTACKSNGACYEVGGGWYSKVRLQRSRGLGLTGNAGGYATAEDIGRNMEEITKFDDEVTYPTSPGDALQAVLKSREVKHAPAAKAEVKKETEVKHNVTLQSDAIFSKLTKILQDDESKRQEVVTKIKAVVLIQILDDKYKHAYRRYLLSFHPSQPVAITSLSQAPTSADTQIPPACVLNANDKTFTALLKGDLSPEFAYMSGKLKIDGHMGVALKIKNLLDIAKNF
eukprot:gene29577-35702_t